MAAASSAQSGAIRLARSDAPPKGAITPSKILKHDDGKPDGRKSIAGTGEMIRFELPEGTTKIQAIKIHGSRYGTAKAPDEDFEISFMSDDFTQVLHSETAPYRLFGRGVGKWVNVKLKDQLELPKAFWIVLNFQAEKTKGVYVSYDTSTEGKHSRIGLPNDAQPREVDFKGDWMVQVVTVAPR